MYSENLFMLASNDLVSYFKVRYVLRISEDLSCLGVYEG